MARLQPPCLEYEHQRLDFGDGMCPSTPGAAPGECSTLSSQAGQAGQGRGRHWALLPSLCIHRQPLGQASPGAGGSGAKEEISNWVWSGWKTREEGELWAAADKPHISESTGRVTKESPGPCCAHPRGVGVPQHLPHPRGGHSPPGHADIQALEFLFISILLSFSHFSLLFTLPSARSHFIPRLRKAAKT